MKKLFILGLFVIFQNNYSLAFNDEETHPRITEIVVNQPSFEDYLIKVLNLKDGLKTKFPAKSEKSVLFWMREGAKLEDNPLCRASNHFHNPLKPWDKSEMSDEPGVINKWCGLTDYGTKYSNVTWATGYIAQERDRIHRLNQRMGWDDARNYFYKALTSTSKGEREGYFAKTFQALGQVMHLVLG